MADHDVEAVPAVLQRQLQLALDDAQRGAATVRLAVCKKKRFLQPPKARMANAPTFEFSHVNVGLLLVPEQRVEEGVDQVGVGHGLVALLRVKN